MKTIFESINVSEERVNGMYVYTWINCPSYITEVCTNRMQSKSKLTLTDLIRWKNDLIAVVISI